MMQRRHLENSLALAELVAADLQDNGKRLEDEDAANQAEEAIPA